jgi:hypothetical protein
MFLRLKIEIRLQFRTSFPDMPTSEKEITYVQRERDQGVDQSQGMNQSKGED